MAFILTAASAGISAQTTANADLQQLAERYQAAFNKGDGKAIGAMYTEDALLAAPTGQFLTGRAAIQKDYETNLTGPFKGAKLTLRPGVIRMVTDDVALIEGTFEVTTAGVTVTGRYLNTVVRRGGQWRLAGVVTIPAAPGAKP